MFTNLATKFLKRVSGFDFLHFSLSHNFPYLKNDHNDRLSIVY